MGDNPVKQEVANFDKQKLKKTSTAEKNHLPTKEVERINGFQYKHDPQRPHPAGIHCSSPGAKHHANPPPTSRCVSASTYQSCTR
uniref:Uncharacterized protein n=1 Tax=Amphiprion ocellaris TaxID=80972 RepID=A0A3Q1BV25_AMPOC